MKYHVLIYLFDREVTVSHCVHNTLIDQVMYHYIVALYNLHVVYIVIAISYKICGNIAMPFDLLSETVHGHIWHDS